jgi:CBS domain containing-hemolysin-like protein
MLISYMDAAATLPAKIIVRQGGDESPLTRLSLATEALTDFAIETPISVAPERHIDDALQDMIRAGVRSLLVMQELVVLGLITASDMLGTRPIQFLQSHLCEGQPCRHKDVHVADIMTPWSDLRLIDFRIIAAATAGDLADQFRNTQDTHMLVIEHSSDKGTAVRGLVSKTRLLRQLGVARPV